MLSLVFLLQAPHLPILELPSPHPFRSVGFESTLGFDGEVCLVDAEGEAGPWWPLQEAVDLQEGNAARRWSALIHGDAGSIAVRLRGQSLPTLAALQPVWISLPSAPPAPPAATRPPVYTRSSWGASAPSCSPTYCNTTHIALHHTASASEYGSTGWSQCASNVLATQQYHMQTRGWCDIGYNYLICPHGDIFEGRGGGDDVRGAHDGYNCGSMGVAMMGYFHAPYSQTLTVPMEDAFVELATWKCEQQAIDPLGSSWYAGFGGVKPNLYGHRDVSSTACPGDLAYTELPALRLRVDAALNSNDVIILDNGTAQLSGSWQVGSSASGRYGPDYLWASTGTAPATASWRPNLPVSSQYEVSLWWPAGSNRNPNTVVGAQLSVGLRTMTVNQQLHGGQWNVLGTLPLPAGSGTQFGISNSGQPGWVVIADAIRLRRL